jgi:hypothetical protein
LIIDGADVEEAPTNRRISLSLRRFTLLQLFMFVALIAAFVVVFVADRIHRERNRLDKYGSVSAQTQTHEWVVSYGTKNDHLVYAVFAGHLKRQGVVQPMKFLFSGDDRLSPVFIKPDGVEVPLTGTKQLFEIVDGQYRDSDERVTLDQFNALMDSNPDEYGIEQLMEFARSHK